MNTNTRSSCTYPNVIKGSTMLTELTTAVHEMTYLRVAHRYVFKVIVVATKSGLASLI